MQSKIMNPLTVIGLFCGVVELVALYTLPKLNETLQAQLVWFVMLFPVLLLGGFMWMLIFRHTHLYAPSDFADPTMFLRSIELTQVIKAQVDEKAKSLGDGPMGLTPQQVDLVRERVSSAFPSPPVTIRMLEVLRELGGSSKGDMAAVAEKLGISEKTVEVYIAQLRSAGLLDAYRRPTGMTRSG